MTQEAFKAWWYNEGSQAPYTHHDCEEHTMRMCEIAWANGAYKEREACAELRNKFHPFDLKGRQEIIGVMNTALDDYQAAIRARGEKA